MMPRANGSSLHPISHSVTIGECAVVGAGTGRRLADGRCGGLFHRCEHDANVPMIWPAPPREPVTAELSQRMMDRQRQCVVSASVTI